MSSIATLLSGLSGFRAIVAGSLEANLWRPASISAITGGGRVTSITGAIIGASCGRAVAWGERLEPRLEGDEPFIDRGTRRLIGRTRDLDARHAGGDRRDLRELPLPSGGGAAGRA